FSLNLITLTSVRHQVRMDCQTGYCVIFLPYCVILSVLSLTCHLEPVTFLDFGKKANVIPVPKVKPPTSIESDLRPISLTPTVSKIFESIVGHRILETTADKFDLKQFGAIKGRSTVHALTDIIHI